MEYKSKYSFLALILALFSGVVAFGSEPEPLAASIHLPELTGRHAGASGELEVMAAISAEGKVASVTVLASPDANLNELFVKAVEKWEFKSATANGAPTIGLYRHQFTFKDGQHEIGESIWGPLSDAYNTASEARPLIDNIWLPTLESSLQGVTGSVELMAAISERGHVLSQYVINSTNRDLEAACVAAIQKWQFKPVEKEGVPVMGIYRHVFRYDQGRCELGARMWDLLASEMSATTHPAVVRESILLPDAQKVVSTFEGEIHLEVAVDRKGEVVSVLTSDDGDREFALVSEKAIRSWKFSSVVDVGTPALRLYRQSFRFEGRRSLLDEKTWVALRPPVGSSIELDPIADELVFPILPLSHASATGKVSLSLAINASGKAVSVGVSEASDEILKEVCVDAITQWKFQPHKEGSNRVVGLYEHTFRFENGQRLFGEKMWNILKQKRTAESAAQPVAAEVPAPVQRRGDFELAVAKRAAPSIPSDLVNVKGSVQVVFVVDSSGTVVDATPSEYTHQELIAPALDAAKDWKFRVFGGSSRDGTVETTGLIEFAGPQDAVTAVVYPDAQSGYNDKAPVVQRQPMPEVPSSLMRKKGEVELRFMIDEHGFVSRVEVLDSSLRRFGEICEEALYRWKFEPAVRDGKAIATRAKAVFGIDRGAVSLASHTFGNEPQLDIQPFVEYSPKPQLSQSLSSMKGYVLVEMEIDAAGRVTGAKIVESSNDKLNEPTIVAGKQWRFTPGYRNGVAVSSTLVVPFFY